MQQDSHAPQPSDLTNDQPEPNGAQTYTREQMRQVRRAIAKGQNPLISLQDVPRWEDQVGVDRIINRRVLELDPLPSPAQVLSDLPLTSEMQDIVAYSRDEVRACLYGQDDRLLVIVGPCSVHDPKAALDYAHRLRKLRDELENDLLIVMRVYFEKPRTTIGWKGLINDPDIDGSHNIQKGLLLARRTLLDVLGAGVATATEFLEPTSPQYISDAVSWGAIGARNTESQVHRQLASGMSMPIGFKNATDGSVKAAINSCIAAEDQHTFFGIDHRGRACAVETLGNPDCHVVLRGSSHGPNYDAASVQQALADIHDMMGNESAASHGLIIDCSHGNSGKDDVRQAQVVREIAQRLAEGEQGITGVMMESFIVGGNQAPAPLSELTYGQSITDKCLSWPVTEQLLHTLADAVRARRWN
ncbi:3-deoxy-7-phosphoheptulonate synthase [Bifidobacterium canis]|uniref:3-deoxy-7-phosphoheptulonate synthase n=1 Tax=Bifidobacterium canis TaxID=2610880 RepID=A0A7K1J585_9BIFI|nr:phospho-2-dehydro-3-deoxyheptonate aldolase [Bifidobacterium canis]